MADYTTDQRKELAQKGQARTDGSFPIVTRQDLANAIMSIGRADPSERASVKAWIIKRARELDAIDLLPSSWGIK